MQTTTDDVHQRSDHEAGTGVPTYRIHHETKKVWARRSSKSVGDTGEIEEIIHLLTAKLDKIGGKYFSVLHAKWCLWHIKSTTT